MLLDNYLEIMYSIIVSNFGSNKSDIFDKLLIKNTTDFIMFCKNSVFYFWGCPCFTFKNDWLMLERPS
jgi:hypothetical protein